MKNISYALALLVSVTLSSHAQNPPQPYAQPSTVVPQKWFGIAAPGVIPGGQNGTQGIQSGDLYYDTSASPPTAYFCAAPQGSTAPACTSVTAGQWTLMGGGGSVAPITPLVTASAPTGISSGPAGSASITYSVTCWATDLPPASPPLGRSSPSPGLTFSGIALSGIDIALTIPSDPGCQLYDLYIVSAPDGGLVGNIATYLNPGATYIDTTGAGPGGAFQNPTDTSSAISINAVEAETVTIVPQYGTSLGFPIYANPDLIINDLYTGSGQAGTVQDGVGYGGLTGASITVEDNGTFAGADADVTGNLTSTLIDRTPNSNLNVYGTYQNVSVLSGDVTSLEAGAVFTLTNRAATTGEEIGVLASTGTLGGGARGTYGGKFEGIGASAGYAIGVDVNLVCADGCAGTTGFNYDFQAEDGYMPNRFAGWVETGDQAYSVYSAYAPPNSSIFYVNDGSVTSSVNNTCTAGGSGAMAFVLDGVKRCIPSSGLVSIVSGSVDLSTLTSVGLPHGGTSTFACWHSDGKTLGYGTAAEITAGTCH